MGRPLFGSLHLADCCCRKCADATSLQPRNHSAHNPVQVDPSPRRLTPQTQRITATNASASLQNILQTISESRASLNRASSVIETVYARLLALRLRIRDNSETMALLPPNTSRMGPDHSAIVLSSVSQDLIGNPDQPSDIVVDSLDRNTESSPDPSTEYTPPIVPQAAEIIRRRLEELASTMQQLPQLAPYAEGVDLFPNTVHSGLVDAAIFPFRHTDHERSSRMGDARDSATSLGRQVEARSAARRTPRTMEEASSRFMELRSSIDSYISRLNRHGEELLAAASSLRQDLLPIAEDTAHSSNTTLPVVVGSNRRLTTPEQEQMHEEYERTWHIQDETDVSGPRSSRVNEPLVIPHRPSGNHTALDLPEASPLSPESPPRPRRRESGRNMPPLFNFSDSDDELDWSLSERPRRLQAPTLDSARLRSDMLGRARAALLSGRADRQANELPPRAQPDSQERRSALQSYERYQDQLEHARAGSSSPVTSGYTESARRRRRTRGWARLDRDGNEIPTDEEEEYERNRAHMRARAQVLSGGVPAGITTSEATMLPPPPNHQRYSYVFSTDTRSETAPYAPSYDTSTVPLRLGHRDRDSNGSRVRPSHRELQRAEHLDLATREYASYDGSSDKESPIPWSPVDLVSSSRNKERRRLEKVRVSVRSPFAGR